MALSVTHSKTLVAPDSGTEDKVYGSDYVSASSHTLAGFPGGTATFLRADNTFASAGTNSGPTFPGGIPLTGLKYPQAINTSVSIGNTDLYTVPAGKRVIYSGFALWNASGIGAIVHYPQVKIGATYYRLSANTSTNNASAGSATGAYIAEAGEIISINTATNNGAVVIPDLIEFDNTCAVYSSKLTTFAVGDNTIYTVPALTTALILSVSLPSIPTSGLGSFRYVNSSGGARTVIPKIKPSGGSAIQFAASAAPADAAQTNFTLTGSFGPADQIIVNTDANTATQIAWVNVMEIT